MSAFGKSQSLKRLEDVRFLTGRGRYVDDIAPAAAAHALFVRSPHAHADLMSVDCEDARAMPGVLACLTAADLCEAGLDLYLEGGRVRNRDGSRGADTLRPVLAEGRVRFVGEPVVCIVAETLAAARDAAEAVVVDYSGRPAHVVLQPGGEALHGSAPQNRAFDWFLGDQAATDAAFAAAVHRVSVRVEHNRVIANSLEPRGAYAEWHEERLHLCVNGQGVWDQKATLARAFRLPEDRIRVTTPDVGGGFGMKAMAYPEHVVIAEAARRLGRPVRWMSERTEAMLTDNAGRDLIAVAEAAFDAGLRITAYRVNVLANLGAYNSQFGQFIQTDASSRVLTGCYDIPAASLSVQGIYTNTTQVDAFRGAGRPEAITTLERLIDKAARELGVDPWELRRRNYVSRFPYRTASGALYDVGDFARVAARAIAEADTAGFAARRAEAAGRGMLRGLGGCSYVEAILGDASESAAIDFAPDGAVLLYVGTQSNGQGHETVFAAFLSERTGIPVDRIRVVQGDSDRIRTGGGTGGSRSATIQASATVGAVQAMVAAFVPFVAGLWQVSDAEVRFDDGAFRAPGTNLGLTLTEAAEAARQAGRADLLRHEATHKLPGRSFPNGAHLAEVEVDPDTGAIRLVRYTVTDDFGNLLHPQLVEGQVHGGVAQGFGQAVTERAVHDAQGQLLTATFMDYGLPRATDFPPIRFTTEPVPSTANILGMKGCGEAGTVGALAAISNAVLDALWDRGVRQVDMPFTPHRVWQWLSEAGRASD